MNKILCFTLLSFTLSSCIRFMGEETRDDARVADGAALPDDLELIDASPAEPGPEPDATPLDAPGPEPDTAPPDAPGPEPDTAPTDAPWPDPDTVKPDTLAPDQGGTCSPLCTSFSCGGPDGCGGTCPDTCSKAKKVYYSVGQNTLDHKSGTPTVTILQGLATFSAPQTAPNMGVGDRVVADDAGNALTVFLTRKLNPSFWEVVTSTGDTPADVTNASVVSISHAFDSLSAALVWAKTPLYVGTADLVAANVALNIPCYHDTGPDTTPATLDGYNTGPYNYIRIYTPTDTSSECNQSQRHKGVWTPTAFSMEATITVEWTGLISIMDSYVRVEGLQLKETGAASGLPGHSVIYLRDAGAADIRISHSLLWNSSKNPATVSGRGVFPSDTNAAGVLYLWNNIIYNTGSAKTGFRIKDTLWSAYLYNNTIWGYDDHGDGSEIKSVRHFKNNIIGDCGMYNFKSGYAADSDHNWSNDTTSTGGASDIHTGLPTWSAVTFKGLSTNDFHLSAKDQGARDRGISLVKDPGLPIGIDIDGTLRAGTWDIGADEL